MINFVLMRIGPVLAIFLSTLFSFILTAQSSEVKVYQTLRTEMEPTIDGSLDDPCWSLVDYAGNFTQYQPEDGTEPTQPSAFKVLYSDKFIYFAFRCYDSNPEEIVSRMSRRDGFQGDWIEVNLDSYNDKRTAFSFTTSVSGVKGDEFVSNDGDNWDPSWNPIWHCKTNIDSLGWTAEVAIPFSQLRYAEGDEQVWGMQVTRRDFRAESRSSWQYIPNNAGYWVSGFGELRGLKGVKKQNQLEIQPYVVAQADFYEANKDHPFRDGSDLGLSAGLDGKFGVTSDLTLDFTINPDFGQVESDPSVIRLDGFQAFFEERRPFFIEGRNVFHTPISNSVAGGDYDQDILFYSRRIGASPHLRLGENPSENLYVDQPDFTSILGAVKFSGKTESGLSIGILESVTQREKATIRTSGSDQEIVVEPLTNFFVSRLQQDFNGGNTVIGGIFTQVHRDLSGNLENSLHKDAYSGSLDFLHRWDDRAWNFNARLAFSHVTGTKAAILRTQTALEHNFQRPGSRKTEVDPNATSLTGTGGNISIGNFKNKFRFQSGFTYRSPELELNDVGFQRNSNELIHYHWMGFRENNPFAIFRNFSVNYNHWSSWDYDGRNIYRALNVNTNMVFNNFWSLYAGTNYENRDISNTWLRGGPSFRRSPALFSNLQVSTDNRKVVAFDISGGYGGSFDSPIISKSIGFGIRVQPSDAFNFSLSPNFHDFYREDQYVAQDIWNDESRYILGQLDQQTLSLTLRFDFNITPEFTIQYYGQPFVSRGEYSDFKRVTDPLGEVYTERMLSFTESQITRAGALFLIDENLDGTDDYSFFEPDFNFIQFRSNLVARWEYIPGSEVFLVWNQNTTRSGDPSENVFTSITEGLFDNKLYNVFLVKLTYRFVK